jgi:hypothetical protein
LDSGVYTGSRAGHGSAYGIDHGRLIFPAGNMHILATTAQFQAMTMAMATALAIG